MNFDEQKEIVRDFTDRTLLLNGTNLSNKSLFVNSRHAFYPTATKQDRRSISSLVQTSTINSNNSDYDYKTFKKNKQV